MTPEILYCFPDSAGKPFRPSNGTEGMIFTEHFCEQCINEKWCHTQNDEDAKCDIWSRTMVYDPSDKEYPEEWVFNEKGWPVCTKWKKWDWGNDRDGWNEPPEPPYEPQDPGQLTIFTTDDFLNDGKQQESGVLEKVPQHIDDNIQEPDNR